MLNHHSRISTNTLNQIPPSGGITELVLAHSHSLAFVLPSLAFLSQQNTDRWLTWLPPTTITKNMLQKYDFDFSRTRFIYPRNNEHAFWLFWEALAEGNSHMVVGAPGLLSEQKLARLEHAAAVGQCSGLILRDRTSVIN
jgi:cell division inhibitor SulA